MSDTDFPDELNYSTSAEANVRIIRAMADVRFVEKMQLVMPLIAKRLIEAGVDFSKAKFDEDVPPADAGRRGKRRE